MPTVVYPAHKSSNFSINWMQCSIISNTARENGFSGKNAALCWLKAAARWGEQAPPPGCNGSSLVHVCFSFVLQMLRKMSNASRCVTARHESNVGEVLCKVLNANSSFYQPPILFQCKALMLTQSFSRSPPSMAVLLLFLGISCTGPLSWE